MNIWVANQTLNPTIFSFKIEIRFLVAEETRNIKILSRWNDISPFSLHSN